MSIEVFRWKLFTTILNMEIKSACLFHFVKREDVIGKRVLEFQEKIYLTDHGMREAIYGNNLRDIDQILENVIYMELFDVGVMRCTLERSMRRK